jgi:toxin-antitoxin system PIN domain toxin
MTGLDTNILVQLADQRHTKHSATSELLDQETEAGRRILIAPQVIAEFLHVITDSKRFAEPLSMSEAIEFAEDILANPDATVVLPSSASLQMSLRWMKENQLGRKRILDSQLAATLLSAGCTRIMTSNSKDFEIFKVFEVLSP